MSGVKSYVQLSAGLEGEDKKVGLSVLIHISFICVDVAGCMLTVDGTTDKWKNSRKKRKNMSSC